VKRALRLDVRDSKAILGLRRVLGCPERKSAYIASERDSPTTSERPVSQALGAAFESAFDFRP